MRLIPLILFVCVPRLVSGEPIVVDPAPMSLKDCLDYGATHSTAARLGRLDVDIARTQVGQARSLALPQLTLDATYRRLDEVQEVDFGQGPSALGNLDNYEVVAGVSQLLYGGGQVGAALRAAALAREHAHASKLEIDADLIRDITVQFYGLLLAEEAVRVQTASVEQLEAYAKQTETREQNGAVSEFDLLTAKVRLANEKPKLIAARNQRDLAVAAFSTLLNHPGTVAVTGTLSMVEIDLSLEEMEALALDNRQALRRSQIRVDLSREDIASSRSDGMPSLRAFFNYHGANAYQFVAFQDDWEWHWNAGLTLSWNIWDGDLTRQTVRQKRYAYAQRQTEYDAMRQSILLEVRQAYMSLQHARESLAASGDSVALAERALEIARSRYESGLSTYIEFTDANLALSTARLTRAQALHDHAVARAEVIYACGINEEMIVDVNKQETNAQLANDEQGDS
jgi:outer membrane protein